ncbi:MAG: glycosyltransferase family 2 protein [Gaiellaceae bacterium]
MPRFSVVVPTRDRPDLLEFCLGSLAEQTFDDFEVLVTDNPVHTPAQEVFERVAPAGWLYSRPSKPVAMHDNFERGCAAAAGDFVAVLVDKTVLHPSALEFAARALEHDPEVEIVNWWNEGYNPVDESEDPRKGTFLPSATIVEPERFDAPAELARRMANRERRGDDQVHYVRGKIVFGAYSRSLLDRIGEQTGRVFYPLAPDYTSMVPACVLAKGALDLGRPLLVSYNSARSNGQQQSLNPSYARGFIAAIDPAIVDALPVPGIYTSHHNVVGYDLVSSGERCPAGTVPELDSVNLVRRIREDLAVVVWDDESERDEQYALLEAAEARLGLTPAESEQRGPSLGELARGFVAARRAPAPVEYPTLLDAARAADRFYAAAAS